MTQCELSVDIYHVPRISQDVVGAAGLPLDSFRRGYYSGGMLEVTDLKGYILGIDVFQVPSECKHVLLSCCYGVL